MFVPTGLAGVKRIYGDFKFIEMSGGNVDVEDSWEAENLVLLRNVCGTKLNIRLHRLVAPEFEAALAEARKVCPSYKIRMLGGYCSRHKMHDPKRELSIHSWGAAFDVNWDTNGVGLKAPRDLPELFVKAFTERGWNWGGNWKLPKDWMHFQLANGI